MIDAQRLADLRASGRLPGPSRVARQLMLKLEREDTPLPEIVRLIQSDPALAGRLLRLANSAAYARPRPAVAITPEVLMLLGLPTVRNLVLAFSLIDARRAELGEGFDYPAFWSRSLAEGCAAQALGTVTRAAPAAEMFTLGLVAEIGKLALLDLEPEAYPQLLRAQQGQDTAVLAEAERRHLGMDHLELSALLLADWGFPKLFQEAVRWHALPEEGWPMEKGERPWKVTATLRLAHRLADCLAQPDEARLETLKALEADAAALGVVDLIAFGDVILQTWRDWGELLAVPVALPTPFVELAARAAIPDEGRLRVLVVEDDAAMARLLEGLLAKAGYAMRLAADAEAGLALAISWLPDIVLTDLVMPGDGLKLIERLRAHEDGRYIYLIVVTILNDTDTLTRAFALGADDYVVKPFDARVLLARLSAGRRMIGLKRELVRRNVELAEALQKAEAAALTDALTGLPNRRYMVARLMQECATARRTGRPLCALSIDIDHFKAINDRFGHAAGDAALVEVARRLRATARAGDVVARFGGEEFLVLAPDTPLSAATQLAERLRAAIAAQPFLAGENSIPLSISIGLAPCADGCQCVDDLLRRADQALYRAKAEGRNRISS